MRLTPPSPPAAHPLAFSDTFPALRADAHAGGRLAEAVLSSDEEAALLDIPAATPLLSLATLSCLEDGTPVEYSLTSRAGNRMRLHVHVSARPGDFAGTIEPRHDL